MSIVLFPASQPTAYPGVFCFSLLVASRAFDARLGHLQGSTSSDLNPQCTCHTHCPAMHKLGVKSPSADGPAQASVSLGLHRMKCLLISISLAMRNGKTGFMRLTPYSGRHSTFRSLRTLLAACLCTALLAALFAGGAANANIDGAGLPICTDGT